MADPGDDTDFDWEAAEDSFDENPMREAMGDRAYDLMLDSNERHADATTAALRGIAWQRRALAFLFATGGVVLLVLAVAFLLVLFV